ncbi:MAG: bifunctional demethylmenaquinone methyltransferase/2-methoxy-6-polyprenyl-1,4-benzoquinol methylase UbiE [Bacteroidales bacterium]|nr:bifunctional demethylmenaquinone methyltransferase/2-methoxy-6-polyprenyl-1,4-benzoquinol methylase UbiE [Bacteroidales bacterium]
MPKKEKVQQMFDNIAPTYDKLNHIMSLSVDKLWRRHALREIVDGRDQRILDIACGTGDSTIAIARKASDGSRVVGTDISDGMMALVRRKAIDRGVDWKIEVEQGDGEALRFGEGSFDAVTCQFGIRNFEHKERGLSEMFRVLKPGGKAVILELSVPDNKRVRAVYDLYFLHVLPWIGGIVSGDKAAYRYLPASVHNFPSPQAFCGMMEDVGFRNVRCRTFTFGLCRMFTGEKRRT